MHAPVFIRSFSRNDKYYYYSRNDKFAARKYTFTRGNPAVLAMDHMEQEEVGRIKAMTMHQEESLNQRKKRKVFSPLPPRRPPPPQQQHIH